MNVYFSLLFVKKKDYFIQMSVYFQTPKWNWCMDFESHVKTINIISCDNERKNVQKMHWNNSIYWLFAGSRDYAPFFVFMTVIIIVKCLAQVWPLCEITRRKRFFFASKQTRIKLRSINSIWLQLIENDKRNKWMSEESMHSNGITPSTVNIAWFLIGWNHLQRK